MITWLVCKNCDIKEALLPATPMPLRGCPRCGAARHAQDDYGRPLVLWSAPQNLDNFDMSVFKRTL